MFKLLLLTASIFLISCVEKDLTNDENSSNGASSCSSTYVFASQLESSISSDFREDNVSFTELESEYKSDCAIKASLETDLQSLTRLGDIFNFAYSDDYSLNYTLQESNPILSDIQQESGSTSGGCDFVIASQLQLDTDNNVIYQIYLIEFVGSCEYTEGSDSGSDES